MKIAMCEAKSSVGVKFLAVSEDGVLFVNLEAIQRQSRGTIASFPNDMIGFLTGGEELIAQARSALEFGHRKLKMVNGRDCWRRSDLNFQPAVPRPGKILHTSVNFASHKKELQTGFETKEWQSHGWGDFHYEHPTGFLQAPSAVTGHECTIKIPRFTCQLDYELELAIVIGKKAKNVSPDEALNHVAGYCVFNDVSARDIQAREHSNKVILLGKSFDSSCPLGPWLTTKDEVPDPQSMEMQLRLNGDLRQDANTSEMIFSVRELVSWWSQITLEPGDVITSGSPSGVIAGDKNPGWLKDGDRIDAYISQLGTLTNYIAAGDGA